MKKRVYVAESHHHVIKEWARYRKCKMHLLSLDFHTDFIEAFCHKSYDPVSHSCSRVRQAACLSKHTSCTDIEAAIKDLRNDQHIDFALQIGMIEKAFVFSHDSNTIAGDRVLVVPCRKKQIAQSRIISYSEVSHPLATPCPYSDITEAKMAKIITTDEVLDEVIKTFCMYGFNRGNYILDVDCDFVRDREAMTHGKFQTLEALVKGAKAVTIAREPCYVDLCSNHTLSYSEIEEWLVELIKGSCGDDAEFVYE